LNTLQHLSCLEDLKLYLKPGHIGSAQTVLEVVEDTSALRRFALAGDWKYTTESLIAFITTHAPTLRSLTINGGLLTHGTCLMVLEELATAARGSLEYVSILRVESLDAGYNAMGDLIHEYGNRLPHFDCVTVFEPPRY